MILEVALFHVKKGQELDFEQQYEEAKNFLASAKGYISHDLRRCIEAPHKYILLVNWESLEDHTVGFRTSAAFQEWRSRVHPFFESSLVEHYA